MEATWTLRAAVVMGVLSMFAPAAVADNLITGVPDWDQPDDYAPATLGLAAGDYPNWCSPTAGACIMGYWEDQLNQAGLADGVAAPGSAPFPNPANANTFTQGLWHDGTVEMGWFMDTGGWRTTPLGFPPKAGWTNLNNIGPGVVAYAVTAWNDPGGAVKAPFVNASFSVDRWALEWEEDDFQDMWDNYTAEIDAGRPVLVSFDGWAFQKLEDVEVQGQNVEKWAITSGAGHTVAGVGYIDTDPDSLGGEWFITEDNKTFTGTYVAVALNWEETLWRQNDYITIPEPVTAGLLGAGLAALALARRKKRS